MFNSWFHIRSIAQYLQSVLPGSVIGSSYTYQKDELVIPIDNCIALQGLQASFHAPLPFLQMETKLSDPKHRVSLFKTMTGLQIAGVRWHRSDREILISLKNGMGYLLLQHYGINGNIYFLDHELQLLESFQKTRQVPMVNPDNFTNSDRLFFTEDSFRIVLEKHPDLTIEKLMARMPVPAYSKILADEISFRSGLPKKTLIINLSDENIRDFYLSYQVVLAEIDQNRNYIYEDPIPLFTLLTLQSQKTAKPKPFDTIIEANQYYISLFYRTDNLEQIRKQLSNRLTLALQQQQRKFNKQKTDLSNLPTANEYREWADTLLVNLHQIHEYTAEIELASLNNPDQRVRIPLNPKLSAAENANKYYEKSRQIEDSRTDLQHSLRNTEQSIQEIAGQLKAIEGCDDLKTMRQIQQQIPTRFVQKQTGPESVERKPYHRFLINDREILVGKSAKDNDLLSFKHARPEDFWFHAEHGPGSHVVVRNPNKQDSLPNELIEITAGIAAFYSKAKHSTIVPVIYTKRKYIWKRKDMPPGKVFTKFTKSVIVKPLDPRTAG
ncbi:MAG: NFACT RNA binding domain-containing protein [bacterium]